MGGVCCFCLLIQCRFICLDFLMKTLAARFVAAASQTRICRPLQRPGKHVGITSGCIFWKRLQLEFRVAVCVQPRWPCHRSSRRYFCHPHLNALCLPVLIAVATQRLSRSQQRLCWISQELLLPGYHYRHGPNTGVRACRRTACGGLV